MFGQWQKWMLISAIAIGGVFEVIKRVGLLPASNDEAAEAILHAGGNLYAREKRTTVQDSTRPARLRRGVPRLQLEANGVSQLVIPPTPKSGTFDSNVGTVAKAQDDKSKTDTEKKEKGESEKNKRRCVKKTDLLMGQVALTQDSEENKDDSTNDGEDSEVAGKDDEDEECIEEEIAKDEEEHDVEEPDESLFGEHSPTVGGALIGGVPVGHQNDQLVGLEEWKKLLLDQPNFKETVRLIELYQSGKISSTLFYSLVKLMLESPRLEIKELGILAAGRTPSFESFHVLINLIKTETFGSPVRQRAEAELKFYSQITFLPVLERVLRSSNDVFAVVYALRRLEESATRYLADKYDRPASAGQQAGTPRYGRYYERFVTILQQLSRSADSQQASQARQTLLSLQELLKV